MRNMIQCRLDSTHLLWRGSDSDISIILRVSVIYKDVVSCGVNVEALVGRGEGRKTHYVAGPVVPHYSRTSKRLDCFRH